jgi:LuxR family transcriptional regulator, maltose regulon positive regulatory protein
MPEPIIATKISAPPLRAGLVARPHLLKLLDEAAAHRLTLVSAPAGFGKSTLAGVWLRATGQPAAWLSIDRNDNNPARFVTYLVCALQLLAADIGVSILAALGSPQPVDMRSHIVQLINELSAVPQPVTLVLDDWHLIDDEQVTLALQTLVEHQPHQLRLVVITREDPALPLARLRSRDQLGEVRAADLRFNAAEAAEFLRQNTSLDLSDTEVAALEHRTEGWIAGLHLAALSMRGAADAAAFIEAFTGSHRYILDYLLEEVFTRQPTEVQDFLLSTCMLERMSGDLCDAALGRAGSASLLEHVASAGLFLMPLDDAHQWYRYHRLFAEALQARLKRLLPHRVADIHRRAAGWFEAAGWLVEAVEHARRSGDRAYFVSLLEQHTLSIIAQGELGLAARWLAALPEAALRESPRLCLDQAWLLFLTIQRRAIQTWLDAAEACLPVASERQKGLLGEAMALRSLLEERDPQRALQLGQAAAEATPASNLLVHGLIHMALASSYRSLGRLSQAFDMFEAAIPLHWEAGNVVGASLAADDTVLLARALGRLGRAEALCQQFLARAHRLGLDQTPAAGVAYRGLAAVLLERGQWEAAGGMLRKALERLARGGFGTDDFARLIEARLAFAASGGDSGQSPLAFLSGPRDFASLPPYAITWLAYQLVERGHLDQALPLLTHLEAVTGTADQPRCLGWRLVRAYQQVMAAIAQRDTAALQAAEAEAGDLAEVAESLGCAGYVIDLLTMQAMAEFTRRALPGAIANLDRALALAEPDQQIMHFVGKGQPMADLLSEGLRQGLRRAPFAQRVLDRFPIPQRSRPMIQTGLAEPLTEREIDVLRLMADGLTYQAIAQRLFVSLNTVRYHVKGLYGKLGIGSRAEAIARGRELHLI